MGNYLKMADRQRILALLALGWSYRRIERETGVRRETVARYDPGKDSKADNWSASSGAKPAKVSTGPQSAARARGRKGGRPKRLNDKKRKLAVQLYREGKHSVDEVCQMMGISKPTLYSYVRDGA
jgi:DNA invertase Pin-like site-specific DNA recombinase